MAYALAVVTSAPPLQASLFGSHPFALRDSVNGLVETRLDDACRILHRTHWIDGADDLFEDLHEALPWKTHRRWMVDHEVLEPRLSTSLPEPSHEMRTMAHALEALLGRPFIASWANLYRDGSDGVSWHGDRFRPGSKHDDVALVSLGGPRSFRIRPRGGGASRLWTLHSGDLLVMSGPIQQRFEHCIPKAASAPPRISIAFRCPRGREFDQAVVDDGRRRVDYRP